MSSVAVIVNPKTGQELPTSLASGGLTTRAPLGTLMQCGTLGGAVTVQAPLSPSEGSCFGVNDADSNASGGPITVDGGGTLIDGSGTLVLNTNGAFAVFVFDRSQWRRMSPRRRLDDQDPKALLLEFVADGPAGPAGPAGATGPAGPGNVLSGTGGANAATISASEVDSNATANAKVFVYSKLQNVAVAHGGGPTATTLFTPARDGRWRIDAVVTVVDSTGAVGADLNVRANVLVQGGVLSLLSGGTDTNPDSTNTPGVGWAITVSGANIVGTATNATGNDLRYGWEARAQEQIV